MDAIALRLEAIASKDGGRPSLVRMEAIALRLEAIAIRMHTGHR